MSVEQYDGDVEEMGDKVCVEEEGYEELSKAGDIIRQRFELHYEQVVEV